MTHEVQFVIRCSIIVVHCYSGQLVIVRRIVQDSEDNNSRSITGYFACPVYSTDTLELVI